MDENGAIPRLEVPARSSSKVNDLSQPHQQTISQDRPWYSYLTLDLLILVLRNSLFHPFIALVFYLSLLSTHTHQTRPHLTNGTLYYTVLLILLKFAIYGNHRLTYGPPRKVIWDDEVVLITGGGSGLGRCLVEMLLRKGVSVGVLDVRGPPEELEEQWDGGLCWCVCDVGSVEEVGSAVERVRRELGNATILINNAASPVSGLPLISSSSSSRPTLSLDQIQKTLTVNTLSQFHLLTLLLPSLLSSKSGCTIITISSILSHLSPANLSDYAASKSAISSLHHSLTHEIAASALQGKVKTILVETGQMVTPLFANARVPWYADFLGPRLEVVEVAKAIVGVLDNGESGVVRLPFYASVIGRFYGMLPGPVQRLTRAVGGLDEAFGRNTDLEKED